MVAYAYNGPRWVLAPDTATVQELHNLQAVEVVEGSLPADPTTYRITGFVLVDVAGVPRRQWTIIPWSMGHSRLERHAARLAEYDRRINVGYPTVLDATNETLQINTPDDKANWLTFKDACRDGIAAGLGDSAAGLPLRCTSNNMHTVTNNQGIDLMNSLRTWYANMMRNNWLLAGQIEAAVDQAALDAIDLTQGWP